MRSWPSVTGEVSIGVRNVPDTLFSIAKSPGAFGTPLFQFAALNQSVEAPRFQVLVICAEAWLSAISEPKQRTRNDAPVVCSLISLLRRVPLAGMLDRAWRPDLAGSCPPM